MTLTKNIQQEFSLWPNGSAAPWEPWGAVLMSRPHGGPGQHPQQSHSRVFTELTSACTTRAFPPQSEELWVPPGFKARQAGAGYLHLMPPLAPRPRIRPRSVPHSPRRWRVLCLTLRTRALPLRTCAPTVNPNRNHYASESWEMGRGTEAGPAGSSARPRPRPPAPGARVRAAAQLPRGEGERGRLRPLPSGAGPPARPRPARPGPAHSVLPRPSGAGPALPPGPRPSGAGPPIASGPAPYGAGPPTPSGPAPPAQACPFRPVPPLRPRPAPSRPRPPPGRARPRQPW